MLCYSLGWPWKIESKIRLKGWIFWHRVVQVTCDEVNAWLLAEACKLKSWNERSLSHVVAWWKWSATNRLTEMFIATKQHDRSFYHLHVVPSLKPYSSASWKMKWSSFSIMLPFKIIQHAECWFMQLLAVNFCCTVPWNCQLNGQYFVTMIVRAIVA